MNNDFRVQFLITAFILFCTTLNGQSLQDLAEQKLTELNTLISTAEAAGVDAIKERLTVRTAEIYLDFAVWDENNIEANTKQFEAGFHYRDEAAATAKLLPDFERQDVITMLEEAILELTQVINMEITRATIPQVDWASVSHDGDQLTFEGRPVFLTDWSWKPETAQLQAYHGQLDGVFITPSYVTSEAGTINSSQSSNLSEKSSGTMGFIFINHRNIPDWAKTKYGAGFEIKDPSNVRYTEYDIDHPGSRELIGALIGGMIPQMAGKQYSNLGYMMCNEPHFINTKKENGDLSWASSGVSEYTIDSFRYWLAKKHEVIADLNTIWGADFGTFDEVSIDIPISVTLQGTPKWYDWMSFNMDRVTNWYQYMKDTIKNSDPTAKVHLKLIPGQWTSGLRTHGLDFEALTRMSDIIGNDTGAEHRSFPWKTDPWEEHYIFEWQEMAMAHDFFKSISPEKIMFNTESHFLSTKASINLYLNPLHARATYWLAHTQGMSASQTWYWSRREDGSARNQNDQGYAGSNNHQPRVVNQVHSTLMDLNAHSEEIVAFQRQRKPIRLFYSKASSINKISHMEELTKLYESLYFDGIPLGFVTKDILLEQDASNWDVVLVYQTQFVTKEDVEALQAYINAGGRVIIDDVSFASDEYGQSISGLTGSMTTVNGIDNIRSAALTVVEAAGQSPAVTVTEQSAEDFPICTWKSIENISGNQVLSIVNVGKVDAKVSLSLNGATLGTTTKDLLKGIDISNEQVLSPYEVLFVELRDEKSQFVEILETNEKALETQPILYPNPSSDSILIQGMDKRTVVRIYNLGGVEQIVPQSNGESISIKHLANGVYLASVSDDNQVTVIKFVKM
ncbi:beta-galactosidase [Reichenbachiella sp.]|uniref:beta-galactosidase n=1 Tax=Reichenbachiella sp. TaxID=2184521 RepID=UPI003BAEE853